MERRLRVLLVSPVGLIGGAEQVLLQLAKYLPQLEIIPSLACLRPGPLGDRAHELGIQTHVFSRNYRYRNARAVYHAIEWLMRLIRELDIDVVHSNFTAHLIGSPASWLSGVPEVWQHYDYPHHRGLLQSLLESMPCSHAVFSTLHVLSGYPRLLATPHSIVQPMCVEPERLRAHVACPNIRHRYGLPAGPLFLTVARLQEHKGHRYLIQAIPEVLKHCPDAVFGLVGKATGAEQQAYQHALRLECAAKHIIAQVHFLGYVPEGDLVALYRTATALVHPAVSEGFGLVLIEAMALGVPVIAAAADGPREIIRDSHTGLLVPTADSAALAQAMVRLLQDQAMRVLLGERGVAFSEQSNVKNMVAQMAHVYRGVQRQLA